MIETERKFIIAMPSADMLSALPSHTVSVITQIYLSSDEGVTERVRRREYSDRTEYTHTKKIRISAMSSIEDEREIEEAEYTELAKGIKPGTHPIRKTRHTVRHDELTLEIDIYPEWQSQAIMECELDSEDKEVILPSYITPIREVTGMREYSNAAMARSFPRE